MKKKTILTISLFMLFWVNFTNVSLITKPNMSFELQIKQNSALAIIGRGRIVCWSSYREVPWYGFTYCGDCRYHMGYGWDSGKCKPNK